MLVWRGRMRHDGHDETMDTMKPVLRTATGRTALRAVGSARGHGIASPLQIHGLAISMPPRRSLRRPNGPASDQLLMANGTKTIVPIVSLCSSVKRNREHSH
jgi:hypothetical protein